VTNKVAVLISLLWKSDWRVNAVVLSEEGGTREPLPVARIARWLMVEEPLHFVKLLVYVHFVM